MSAWSDLVVTQDDVVGKYQRLMANIIALQASVERRIAEKYGPGGFIKATSRAFVDATDGSLGGLVADWTKARVLLIKNQFSTLENFRQLNPKMQSWAKPEQVKAICGDPPPDGSTFWDDALKKSEYVPDVWNDQAYPKGTRSRSRSRDVMLALMCYVEPNYSKEDRSIVDAWDAWRNNFLRGFNEYVGEHNEVSKFFFTSSMAQNDVVLRHEVELRRWIDRMVTDFKVKFIPPKMATTEEIEAMKPTTGIPWKSLATLALAGLGIYALWKFAPTVSARRKPAEPISDEEAVKREKARMASWPESKALERAKLRP